MAHEGITIAVDALGGDNAPAAVLSGVELALTRDPSLTIDLCGPADVVTPFCDTHERCVPIPCTEFIDMDEHPANAVRHKKDSSIVVGCRLVKEGKADGFFSAGSTGACLAAGTLIIGRLKGISRPALCTVLPSPKKPVVMCDVGANAECKPEYLVQFAEMARIYTERVVGVKDPKVALLNIGSEDTKGDRFAQEAHELMRDVPGFAGNAEGHDILAGRFDVIVTDGFTGNVCLKTIEGTAKVLMGELKNVLMSSLKTKLAAGLVKSDLLTLKQTMSSDTYGGAPLLGVKGACIVGHGSSSPDAIANGIAATSRTISLGVQKLIEGVGTKAQAEKAAHKAQAVEAAK